MKQLIQVSRYVAVGTVLVAMLVLAACGGGSTPTPTPTPTDVPPPTLMPAPTPTPKPPPLPTASPASRPAASKPEQRPLTDEALAKFAAYVEGNRKRYKVPRTAVVVVQGGDVVFAQGFGVKEVGGNDPVTPDTMFSIGSTTKAMTSMMAATLAR